jgi:hypothetical protein
MIDGNTIFRYFYTCKEIGSSWKDMLEEQVTWKLIFVYYSIIDRKEISAPYFSTQLMNADYMSKM